MAIELTEKMIHRTIGTVVLVIFMITITPSFFHKSHLKIEQQLDLAVNIPKPPVTPKIIIASEPKIIPIKPTQVNLEMPSKPKSVIVKKTITNLRQLSKVKIQQQKIIVAPVKQISPKKAFTVQLGSFGDKRNALNLINNLKRQGFTATIAVLVNKNTHVPSYRVLAGKEQDRNTAVQLQKKLASLLQLNGFVVYEEIA